MPSSTESAALNCQKRGPKLAASADAVVGLYEGLFLGLGPDDNDEAMMPVTVAAADEDDDAGR